MRGPQFPKLGHVTQATPSEGWFVVQTQLVSVLYACVKFEADISIHSEVIRLFLKFRNWVTWPRPRPLMSHFRSARRSGPYCLLILLFKQIAEFVRKLWRESKISTLGQVTNDTPNYGSLYGPHRTYPTTMSVPNFKRISVIVQKLQRCCKILKYGHVTVSHARFEHQPSNLCRNPSTHTYCHILFFRLDPLVSYGWEQCQWATLMAKLAICMRGVTWPECSWSSETTYLYSETPIWLFII